MNLDFIDVLSIFVALLALGFFAGMFISARPEAPPARLTNRLFQARSLWREVK